MARRQVTVTITADGRDKGKVFVLTEKSARDAEDWAARALFAMMNSGMEIPENIAQQGLAGVAALGIKSLTNLSYDLAKPLLDDMLGCIQFQPGTNASVVRRLFDDDIEEVATFVQLRQEILSLHIDFFTPAVPSTSDLAASETAT